MGNSYTSRIAVYFHYKQRFPLRLDGILEFLLYPYQKLAILIG